MTTPPNDITIHIATWVKPFALGVLSGIAMTLIGCAIALACSIRGSNV